jgi:DNA-directed RNA polymerase specialized sigma24 family protein
MVDEIRRMGAHQRAVVAFAPQTDQTRDEFTPERVLQAQERLRLLASVIRAAPDPRRSSFIQARLDGLSAAEIARRTGYSESNIKKHIMLVMRDLEAALAAAERSKVRKGSGS